MIYIFYHFFLLFLLIYNFYLRITFGSWSRFHSYASLLSSFDDWYSSSLTDSIWVCWISSICLSYQGVTNLDAIFRYIFFLISASKETTLTSFMAGTLVMISISCSIWGSLSSLIYLINFYFSNHYFFSSYYWCFLWSNRVGYYEFVRSSSSSWSWKCFHLRYLPRN